MPNSYLTACKIQSATEESTRCGPVCCFEAVLRSRPHLGTRRMTAARTPVTDRITNTQPSMKTAASAVLYGSCKCKAGSGQRWGKGRLNVMGITRLHGQKGFRLM